MFKFLQKNKNTEEEFLIKKRQEVSNAIDENIKIAEAEIENIKSLMLQNEKYKTDFFNSLYNVSIYTSIFDMDTFILSERYVLAKRDYEKKLFSRTLALTIIEFLDDINPLLGRDLSNQLAQAKLNSYIQPLRNISKKFAKYKTDNEKYLRVIRNKTIAHKSTNALELHKFISEIDDDKIYQLVIDLKDITNEFTKLTTKIIYSIIDFMKKDIKNRQKNRKS